MTEQSGEVPGPPSDSRVRIERRDLLLIRVWELLRIASACGKLTYQRKYDLPDLHRSVIAMVGNYGGATFSELVALIGREKAQISHAISDLIEAGMLERPRLRSPVVLTTAGSDLFERFMAVAEKWNAELTEGVPRLQIAVFLRTLQKLTDRAAMVLAHEQEAAVATVAELGVKVPEMSTFPERLRRIGPDTPMSLLVAPRLMTLFAYLDRGAGLTYRRLLRFSMFETIMISHLGDRDETLLTELIELTDRDKGQVGRMLKTLETAGLVERAPSSSLRRVVLRLTARGRGVSAQMVEIAQLRDALLMEGISHAEQASFTSVLDVLTVNASRMLRKLRETDLPAGAEKDALEA
ncbi:MarR family winged helix-turn-helix transcriptional regulator [Tsuneonella sp. HG222]